MKDSYFIYKGIKYIIKYDNNDINIYKGDNLEELSLEEKKEIEELLNSDNGYVYYSQLITNIVYSNHNIEEPQYMIYIFEKLESFLPEEYRESLYRNLETLTTSLKLDTEIPTERNFPKSSTVASYDVKDNKLTVDEKILALIWDQSQKHDKPKSAFTHEYEVIVLHEFIHMASSRYNPETKVGLCGLDKFPTDNKNAKNRGLTEGYTDFLARSILSDKEYNKRSGYHIEIRLIEQLMNLIGQDVIMDSYFNNLGVILMEDRLNKIIGDFEKSFKLFRDIEANFILREKSDINNCLGNAQSSLLDYLDQLVAMLLRENKIQEANNLLTNYGKKIITMDDISSTRHPERYNGIEESIMKYDSIKDKYSSYINDRLEGIKII